MFLDIYQFRFFEQFLSLEFLKKPHNMDFIYQDPYPILKDDTQYRKITSDFVKVEQFGDRRSEERRVGKECPV